MDRLSTLLSQFGVRASLFYNGNLCGMASYDGADQRGRIHLLQAGSVTLRGADRKDLLLTQPSLIFLPRPRRHQLFAGEPEEAQLLCASMKFVAPLVIGEYSIFDLAACRFIIVATYADPSVAPGDEKIQSS